MNVPLYQAKADFFRTLGHPARIRILELLAERDHSPRELLEHEIGPELVRLAAQVRMALPGATRE